MDISIPGAPGAAALAKLHQRAYTQAKTAAYEQSAADPRLTEHRQVLRDLVGEIKDCVPFPVSIVDGNDRYTNEEAVIDIAPHDFELARLIEKLNWTVRFALTKGHGSATKMPDVLALAQPARATCVLAASSRRRKSSTMISSATRPSPLPSWKAATAAKTPSSF